MRTTAIFVRGACGVGTVHFADRATPIRSFTILYYSAWIECFNKLVVIMNDDGPHWTVVCTYFMYVVYALRWYMLIAMLLPSASYWFADHSPYRLLVQSACKCCRCRHHQHSHCTSNSNHTKSTSTTTSRTSRPARQHRQHEQKIIKIQYTNCLCSMCSICRYMVSCPLHQSEHKVFIAFYAMLTREIFVSLNRSKFTELFLCCHIHLDPTFRFKAVVVLVERVMFRNEQIYRKTDPSSPA